MILAIASVIRVLRRELLRWQLLLLLILQVRVLRSRIGDIFNVIWILSCRNLSYGIFYLSFLRNVWNFEARHLFNSGFVRIGQEFLVERLLFFFELVVYVRSLDLHSLISLLKTIISPAIITTEILLLTLLMLKLLLNFCLNSMALSLLKLG